MAGEAKISSEVRAAWLFVGPGLAIIFLFFLLPIAAALLLSLTDFDLYAVADWHNLRFVGFENYLHLLRDPLFWKAMRNCRPLSAPIPASVRNPRAKPATRCRSTSITLP